VTLGETREWLRDPAIADVPHPGERISRGRPICTVFASGRNAGACLRALAWKARTIYRAAEPGVRGVA
jgi:predicted ATP-grasp superfamily ATP-dependent carboligase